LEDKDNRDMVLSVLKSKIFGQPDLFSQTAPKALLQLAAFYYEKYQIKYGVDVHSITSIPPAPAKAEFHNIDIKGLEINDVKTFGAEHLCKQVLDRLELRECFTSLGMSQKQVNKALLSIAGRADKLVIFDISNTYFETRKANSKLAKYGRSKEKRSDCPLVVFTGVINPQGFIRHSRIYQGNTADTATLEDMIKDLSSHICLCL